jgi:hypothetical protein
VVPSKRRPTLTLYPHTPVCERITNEYLSELFQGGNCCRPIAVAARSAAARLLGLIINPQKTALSLIKSFVCVVWSSFVPLSAAAVLPFPL